MAATVTLATTTLDGAISIGTPLLVLASTADIQVGDRLWIDTELVAVTQVTVAGGEHDPAVVVRRGVDGTIAVAHEDGSTVTIGNPQDFYSTDPPSGGVGPEPPLVLPWINVLNGTTWIVDDDNQWRLETGPIIATEVVGPPGVQNPQGSYQPVGVDLILAPTAGSADGTDPKFLAPVMGHVTAEEAMTNDANYVAGVIGAYSLPGTNASTYPKAAVLALLMDPTNDVTVNGVTSSLDGDSGEMHGGAFYGVMSQNSTALSGMDYGLDLQSAAHDGFLAVGQDRAAAAGNFYKVAPVRICNNVVILIGDAAPTDGTTGDNVAGEGSLYIRVNTGNAGVFINTGTITSPAWKEVTHA